MRNLMNSHIFSSYSKTITKSLFFSTSLSPFLPISLFIYFLVSVFFHLSFSASPFWWLSFPLSLSLSSVSHACYFFVSLSHLSLSISVSVPISLISPLASPHLPSSCHPWPSPHHSFQGRGLTRRSSFSQLVFCCCQPSQ